MTVYKRGAVVTDNSVRIEYAPRDIIAAYEDRLPRFCELIELEGGCLVTDWSTLSDFNLEESQYTYISWKTGIQVGSETPVWEVLRALKEDV